jgi:hypothetical protein
MVRNVFKWGPGIAPLLFAVFVINHGAFAQSIPLNPKATITIPADLGQGDHYFFQYCRSAADPSGRRGCGFWSHRWISTDAVPVNELFYQANYHPAILIHNSAPIVSVASVSRSGNVVTINTASAHNLVSLANVVVGGVVGCSTPPNGIFVVTSTPTITQFTYSQTGPNETCTPNTGTAQGGARASLLFQENDSTNRPRNNWIVQADSQNDRAFQFLIGQNYNEGDPDAKDRLLFEQINSFASAAGNGTAMQSRMHGNLENRGFIKSKAFVNDTSGRAAIALERTTADGSGQAWITLASTSASKDIVFAGIRDWSWPYWRFYNDGTGQLLTQNSGVDVPTEIASSQGVRAQYITLKSGTGIVKFASSTYASVDVGLSRVSAGKLAVGDGVSVGSATGQLRAASFESNAADVADSGVIRVANAECAVASEASPAGTDVCALDVDANEVTRVGATGGSGVKIGDNSNTAAIRGVLTGTASLDFDLSGAGITCQDLTISVTGAADGDPVSLGIPNALASMAGVVLDGWVSAVNTVSVRACDVTSGNPNPAAATVRAAVTKF